MSLAVAVFIGGGEKDSSRMAYTASPSVALNYLKNGRHPVK